MPSAPPSTSSMPSPEACQEECTLPSGGKGGSGRMRGAKGTSDDADEDESSAAPSAAPGVLVCVFSAGAPAPSGKGGGGRGMRRRDRELRTHRSGGKGSGPSLETRCVDAVDPESQVGIDETFVSCGCCSVDVPMIGEVCLESTCSAEVVVP
jgi:hypothetical protein